MKNAIKNIFLVLGLGAMISGCFSGSYHYDQPSLIPPEISECEIEIHQDINDVWQAALSYINDTNIVQWEHGSTDPYQIDASFKTYNPNEYCDCGTVHSWIKNAKVRRDYTFPAASTNQMYEFLNEGQVIKVQRKLSLSGNVHITFHELQNDHTKVKVMIEYALTKNTTAENAVTETIPSTHLPSINYFTSTTLGTDSNQIICRSTLTLEKSILHKINEYVLNLDR
jgi:hypothetical protein